MRYQSFQMHGLAWLIIAAFLLRPPGVSGAEPVTAPVPKPVVPSLAMPPSASAGGPAVPLEGPTLTKLPSWSETLHAVLLTAIPDKYEDLSHWGKTNEIFAGVRIQQRGLHLRFSDRKRTVKHGAWHRYKIELIDPSKTLKLLIDQIQPVGAAAFRFDIRLAAKLRCRADFEHWVLGVKGLNFTVVSEADVRVVAHCQLAIHTERRGGSLLPDLVLDPRVNGVELFLSHLETRRIGEIRGDIAEELGDRSRHYIENLLQAQESRVVKKANEAIEKKRGNLRIPASKLW
jgi:hypothetical protein